MNLWIGLSLSPLRATDDQEQDHQENPIDSSGLMHLIATGGGTTVNDPSQDDSLGTLPIVDPTPALSQDTADEVLSETLPSQLPLVTVPSSSSAPPMDLMDTDPQDPSLDLVPSQSEQVPSLLPAATSASVKSQHNIEEIHREMMTLIPIPQAWSHIRHQSGLFSYPDLPHFNVIRQATFRDGRFVCPFCTVDFASKEGIRYHLYNSCTKSPYPKAFFRCLMCGSELADRSSLRTHLARHVSPTALLSKVRRKRNETKRFSSSGCRRRRCYFFR